MKFHECPTMTRNDCVPARVFMATVAPMDKHGYFSFGAGCSSAMAAVENAEYVLVEVNSNMPRVLGGNQESIHISQVDFVVESSNQPLPTIPDAQPSETDKKIAGYILNRLYDGCYPTRYWWYTQCYWQYDRRLRLKDLGVHTEMYVDAYLKMSMAGKITGARKRIDRYKQVFSFAMGSRELYDFIDDNPGLIAYSVDYTNNPTVVASIDDFVSVNACIEVDLFGQVCAESVGVRHISGTGGQLDFVEGAYKSRGGQSFICMTSTFEGKNGLVSALNQL